MSAITNNLYFLKPKTAALQDANIDYIYTCSDLRPLRLNAELAVLILTALHADIRYMMGLYRKIIINKVFPAISNPAFF